MKQHHYREWLFLCVIVFGVTLLMQSTAGAAEVGRRFIPVSRVIDRDIFTKNGDNIGEIDDLVIKRSGRVQKLTFETGGFLDMGDRIVAVSFKRIMPNGMIILDMTEEEIKKKEMFDYYRQGLSKSFFYYFGPGPYAPYRAGPDRRNWRYYHHRYAPYGPFDEYQPYPTEPAFSPPRFLASAITGRAVVNENRQFIGSVADLIIDTEKREVASIIFQASNVRDEGTYVAVPYRMFGFTPQGLVCDVSLELIRKQPEFRYND